MSDDIISRKAAINAIHCDIIVTGKQNAETVSETIAAFVDRIKNLPPAEPEISADKIKRWLDRWEGYIDKDIIARMKYRVIDIPFEGRGQPNMHDLSKDANTIPVEWIRQQAEEFPGMESAMWGKLIRLWKKKIACEELYGGDNEDN